MVLHADIEVRDSKIAGKGLYAKAPIKAGTIVSDARDDAACIARVACAPARHSLLPLARAPALRFPAHTGCDPGLRLPTASSSRAGVGGRG